MPVVSSQLPLFAKPLLYTTFGMVSLFPYAPACSRRSGRVKEDQSGSVDTVTPPGRERVFLCKLEHNERLFASPDKVICSMMFFSREAASRWSINVLRTSECLVTIL